MKLRKQLMTLSVAGCCLLAANAQPSLAADTGVGTVLKANTTTDAASSDVVKDAASTAVPEAATSAVTEPAPVSTAAPGDAQASAASTAPPAAQGGSAAENASDAVTVSTRSVADKSDTLKVDLQIPVVQGMKDEAYQSKLNDTLYQTAMQDLDSLKKQRLSDAAQDAKDGVTRMMPYEIVVRYTLDAAGGESDAGMLSLEVVTYLYTGGAHGMSRVDTYNVWNGPQARHITLQDLFGADYKALIDKHIRDEIAKQPELYFKDAFQGIDDTCTFYIEKGDAVIVFSEYEIAPYAAGNPKFRIPIRLPSQLMLDGKKLALEDAAAYTDAAGTTMVPLRAAAEGLGYAVKWNEEQRAAEVSKGARSTLVKVGKDEYVADSRAAAAAAVSLGTAPVIEPDGNMYVPLKFFSEIVKLQASVDKGVVSLQSAP